MAKIKESFDIVLRKTMVCPKGDDVVQMFNNGQTTIPSVITTEIVSNNKYGVCLNELGNGAENVYALIESVKGSEEFDKSDIEHLRDTEKYEIVLSSINGRLMEGKLNVFVSSKDTSTSSVSELSDEVTKACDEAIKNGFVTKEEMDARMKVFKENDVDDFLILRILKRYRNYNKPSHKPSCIFQDPYLDASRAMKSEGIIAEGLRAAASRTAIICEGEKSVGKNVYLETIAWLMNMPMYLITFSRQMSPSSIYGEKTTDNSAAQALADLDPAVIELAEKAEFAQRCFLQAGMKLGHTGKALDDYVNSMLPDEWKNALVEKALFEKRKAQASSVNIVIDQSELYDWLVDGGILVFNEMNMAEANFFASFTNQLLDGTGFLFIPGRGEVSIHPDCVLFGTQNADYQGVEMQNEATMSRFGCIVFPQPESIKKQIIAATEAALRKGDFPNAKVDSKCYTQCQNFYKQCRASVNKGDLTNACLNIRGFVRALTAVAESNGRAKLKRQIEIQVINTCPTDDRTALYATLEQMVTL